MPKKPKTKELTITGRPIAKKNSRRIFRRGGKTISLPSKAYEKYETNALEQLLSQKQVKFHKPLAAHYTFFIKGKYHVDVDNLIAGVNDIIEKAGIIDDDDLITKGTFEKRGGCDGWSTKIVLESLR